MKAFRKMYSDNLRQLAETRYRDEMARTEYDDIDIETFVNSFVKEQEDLIIKHFHKSPPNNPESTRRLMIGLKRWTEGSLVGLVVTFLEEMYGEENFYDRLDGTQRRELVIAFIERAFLPERFNKNEPFSPKTEAYDSRRRKDQIISTMTLLEEEKLEDRSLLYRSMRA